MDITELILADHREQRRMFALLDEIGDDPDRLGPVWRRLAVLLEVHADAEERLFYPRLLAVGSGAGDSAGPTEETKDAIRDHDDIRDGLRQADRQPAGSQGWWEAVRAARLANSDHMAEEEREALADFRRHATLAERHDLAVEFAVYEAAHAAGVPLRDTDPDRYVAGHAD
ncbi:MAG: hemerythrin domain-containing protein [Actinomycetota bacterium]|nr:hemerythrin domain-containing protein [Actinomycetota bacterium]